MKTGKSSSSRNTGFHASSKLTADRRVSRSMRFGSYPNWITLPGVVRSVIEISNSPNPSPTRAVLTRSALSGVGRNQKIYIPGVTGETMPRDCKCANDQVISSVRSSSTEISFKSRLKAHRFGALPESRKKYRFAGPELAGNESGYPRCRRPQRYRRFERPSPSVYLSARRISQSKIDTGKKGYSYVTLSARA